MLRKVSHLANKAAGLACRHLYPARAFFAVTVAMSFVGNANLWYGKGVGAAIYWLLIGALTSYVYAALASSRRKWVAATGYLLGWVQIALCVINTLSWALWGFGISHQMLGIVCSTNMREVAGFCSTFGDNLLYVGSSPMFWVAAAGVVASAVGARHAAKRPFGMATAIVLPISLTLTVFHVSTNEFNKRDVSLTYKTAICLQKTVGMIRRTNETRKVFSDNRRDIPPAASDGLTDNMVVILGESSSPYHWQLYGYPLATTPRLRAMSDSLIVKKNTIPPYQTTREATRGIFTEYESEGHTGQWYAYADIVSLAKKSGAKTYWLSNQAKVSLFTDWLTMLSETSDVSDHVGVAVDGDYDILFLDDNLLPSLDKALVDSTARRRLIILHQNGSHFPYNNTFPPEAALFTPGDERLVHPRAEALSGRQLALAADYDNSILQTDKFIAAVIERMARAKGRNVLVYLSDHSEEVFEIDDYSGHCRRGALRKVPQIYWANYEWRASHPAIVDNLRARDSLTTSSEWMFHTMLNLMGIKTAVYDPAQDVSCDGFDTSKRAFFEGKAYEEEN